MLASSDPGSSGSPDRVPQAWQVMCNSIAVQWFPDLAQLQEAACMVLQMWQLSPGLLQRHVT